MQIDLTFSSPVKNTHVVSVPTGKLIVTRVPRLGWQGVHRPTGKFSGGQVYVPAGKLKTVEATKDALIEAWLNMTGVTVDKARFVN
jgi:hypothetical protein